MFSLTYLPPFQHTIDLCLTMRCLLLCYIIFYRFAEDEKKYCIENVPLPHHSLKTILLPTNSELAQNYSKYKLILAKFIQAMCKTNNSKLPSVNWQHRSRICHQIHLRKANPTGQQTTKHHRKQGYPLLATVRQSTIYIKNDGYA